MGSLQDENINKICQAWASFSKDLRKTIPMNIFCYYQIPSTVLCIKEGFNNKQRKNDHKEEI